MYRLFCYKCRSREQHTVYRLFSSPVNSDKQHLHVLLNYFKKKKKIKRKENAKHQTLAFFIHIQMPSKSSFSFVLHSHFKAKFL